MKRYFFFSIIGILLLSLVAATLMQRGVRAGSKTFTTRQLNGGPAAGDSNPAGSYFNNKTNPDPGGAVKGQIVPSATLPPAIVFTTQLTPANEVPPVTNADVSAVGEAIVTLHVTQDSGGAITAASADFAIVAINLPASDVIILSHIHRGLAGAAGPPVVDSGLSPGSPVTPLAGTALIQRSNLTVSPSLAQDLVDNPSGFYFNVHTNTSPGGAIRGQLAPVSLTNTPLIFAAQLAAGNEVPPVTGVDATGFGVAVVALLPNRDSSGAITGATAQFDVFVAGLPSTEDIILSHIHQGAAGVNGSVVVDSGLSPGSPLALGSAGTATFSRAGLTVSGATTQAIIANPAGFYFNVHTMTNPGGAVRGQLDQAPVITAASAAGRRLFVTGLGFQAGAVILINGQPVGTKNDNSSPSTSLIAKKGGKLIPVGTTAILQVQNPDGIQSASFSFNRTQ